MGNYARVDAPTNMDNSNDLPNVDVPDKFKSEDGTVDVEKLAGSYRDLEAKMGQGEEAPAEATTEAAPGVDLTVPDKPDAIGPDYFNKFAGAYNEETGKLDEASYKQIISDIPGATEDLIDQFVAGQRAQGSGYASNMYALAGGEKGYGEMTTWAQENLGEDEVSQFNSVVESGDVGAAQVAIKGLHARFLQDKSNPPAKRVAASGFGAEGNNYHSFDEYVADCAKPEYSQSGDYRRKCWDKLQRSGLA